jgi:small subunit ribosomal protein S18
MAKSRSKNKDNARRAKKKTSILTTDGVDYVDWKDVNLLRRFMSERSKVRARRVTGNDAQQQKAVARAIKNAREMALMPYVTRITQQRGPRGDRAERGSGGERPGRGGREEPIETGADEDVEVSAEGEALAVATGGDEGFGVDGDGSSDEEAR